MPTWRIEDDCISKAAKLTLNYSGPDPFSVYQKIRPILMTVTLVKKEHIWEKDFRWDNMGDPHGFFIRMYVYKKYDMRTFIIFELIFQGKQPTDPTRNGSMTMTISARLVTDYRLESSFQQSVIYRSLLGVYQWLFYNEVRRSILEECNEFIDKILERIRTELAMETKPKT